MQGADLLFHNRQQQQIIDNLPADIMPENETAAYNLQEQLVERLVKHHNSSVCGYKLACTNKPVMELLGVTAPFSGRLLKHSTHSDGTILPATDFVHRIVELEFTFQLKLDVPFSDCAYNSKTIRPFIGDIFPSVEVVDHRYTDFRNVGGKALIADNAIHGASIIGLSFSDWHSINLDNQHVQLYVNDNLYSEGYGRNVLESPLNAMAWLANHLQSRHRSLRAGEFVTTGTACDIYNASAGDSIRAEFGTIGSLNMGFS